MQVRYYRKTFKITEIVKHWDGAWENYEIWNLYHQMFLRAA